MNLIQGNLRVYIEDALLQRGFLFAFAKIQWALYILTFLENILRMYQMYVSLSFSKFHGFICIGFSFPTWLQARGSASWPQRRNWQLPSDYHGPFLCPQLITPVFFHCGRLGLFWKFLLLHVISVINYPSCRIFLAAKSRNYSFSRQIAKRPFSQCFTILNSALWSPLGHFHGDNHDVDSEEDEWYGNRDKIPGPSAQLYLAFFNVVCIQNFNNRRGPNL